MPRPRFFAPRCIFVAVHAGAKFLAHSAEFLRRGACLSQVSPAPVCLFARPVLAHLLMVHYAQPRGPFVPHGPPLSGVPTTVDLWV